MRNYGELRAMVGPFPFYTAETLDGRKWFIFRHEGDSITRLNVKGAENISRDEAVSVVREMNKGRNYHGK